MLTPFTIKYIRKIPLSSLFQQRAGLTMTQPMILCPKNQRYACMYSGCRTGLMVWQTSLGKVILLVLQTCPLSVPLPCHNPPLEMTTMVPETSFPHLLLSYLTHHPLPSQPTVVPSVNIPLTNLLVLFLPFPIPMSMTSCLFQTQMFLLAVRLAQAQSNRRSMDHQPSYQPARNSRSSTIPSRSY